MGKSLLFQYVAKPSEPSVLVAMRTLLLVKFSSKNCIYGYFFPFSRGKI